MKPVSYWRRAHKRNSVRALMVGVVVQAAAGAWSAIPGAYLDTFPRWVPFAVSGALFLGGLIAAYTHQSSLEE